MHSFETMKIFLGLLAVIFFLAIPPNVLASTFYVDNDLAGNCSGNYSITNRNCTGTDGNAYKTIASGISALSAGDTVYIRSGNYSTTANTINVSGGETLISGYLDEEVVISKSTIRQPLFGLTDSTSNLTIKNLTFQGSLYQVISGSWTNTGGNVWTISLSPQPTQIRFNTTAGAEVGSSVEVNSSNKWYWSSNTLYIYSVGDPSATYTTPGINQTDNYDAIAIGNPSGTAGNLITIDNCIFSDFAHTAIKGNFRFHISNSRFSSIGTDDNDHDIYLTGEQSEGNESIIEYNEFNYTPGALIHLYSHPSYVIIRYNILNGKTGSDYSTWGILLSGNHLKVYNNSFYGNGIGISFYTSNSHDNEVINNIFYGSNGSDYYIDTYGDSFFPVNNISIYNYFGSSNKCSGCSDKTGSGGDNYTNYLTGTNIQSSSNPYVGTLFTDFVDFLLPENSALIDSGYDLGLNQNTGLTSEDGVWPISLIDQSDNGSGWEFGAFINFVLTTQDNSNNTTLSQPSGDSSASNTSCPDPSIVDTVNLFQIKSGKESLTLYFTGVKNATKYLIFYGIPNTPEQFATTLKTNSTAVISYTINKLQENTAYQFKVIPATDCLVGKNSKSLIGKTGFVGVSDSSKVSIANKSNEEKLTTPTAVIISKDIQTQPTPKPETKTINKRQSFAENFWNWIKSIFTP